MLKPVIIFKKQIYLSGCEKKFTFICEQNNEPIEIGDYYLFYFAGAWIVAQCQSENEKFEINKNERKKDETIIDLTTGFWKYCYKIRRTNFDCASLGIN